MWHAARILILGLLCWNLVWAETMPRGPVRGGGGSLDVANPYVNSRVVSNGIIAFNLTNYGYFGNDGPSQSQALQDDCNGEWAPQFEYPEGSDNQYLFQGALWVGAIIVEEGGETKRVSVGTDGWFTPSINEFYPGEGEENGIVLRSNIPGAEDCFGNSIFDPAAVANLEAEATFTDTLMDWFWIEEDPADGQHRPLGLEITQTAKCWTSPDFGKFVILDFHIENIGTNFLKQLALGLYLDSDVGTATEFEHHTDDIAGSIAEDPQTGNLIAWIADNDGRGPEGGTGPVLYPHCMGAAYLTAVDSFYSDHARSFNWWISNGEPDLDFGPSWTDGPNWTQTYGTPVGDERKHNVMTGRERDFDQIEIENDYSPQLDTVFECGSDGQPHDWFEDPALPNATKADIADGYDTRFLISAGPLGLFDYVDGSGRCIYRLNPGEHVDLVTVLLIGEYFHDPNNPQPNPTDLDPSLFSFEGLRESMARARLLYEDGYNWQPPTPVTNLQVTDAMDEAVPLVWDVPLLGGHAGYRVYGRPNSGEGERAEFTSGAIPNLNFTVTGLTNGDRWLFEVETWDGAGYRSAMASRLVAVGAIPDDLHLSGSVEGNDITITWNAVEDPTLSNYRVMRRSSEFDSTSFAVSGTEQHYVDAGVVSGRTYTYWVRAENSFGIPGLNSDSLALTGFAPQPWILVFDETKAPTEVELNRGAVSDDSVRWAYESILIESDEIYAYYDRGPSDPWPTLEELGQYEMVIWHHENPSPFVSAQEARARAELQSNYVAIGGKLIRLGKQSLHGSFGYYGRMHENTLRDFLAPMTFDSLFASVTYNATTPHSSTRTIGVTGLDTDFPTISWNPDRIAQMSYHGQPVDFLPEVDLFWPNGNTWPLYSVVMHESDSTEYDGAPCAVIGPRVIQFGFPLYFVPPTEAAQLLTSAIEALRTQDVDAPEIPKPLPEKIALHQNYPNPFNAMTTIEYELPLSQIGALRIYNITGQLVTTLQDGLIQVGSHRVMFDATGLASGLYFYRLELAQQSVTRKMLLLK